MKYRNGPVSAGGFTLVEVMMVISIVGFLVCLSVPSFRRARIRSQVSAYLADRKTISEAVEIYRIRRGGADPTDVYLPPPELEGKERSNVSEEENKGPVAPTGCISPGLYPYLSQKFRFEQPKNPFGGIWYTVRAEGLPLPESSGVPKPSLCIVATLPSRDTISVLGPYLPSDGRTTYTDTEIFYFL
jgi:prepilin-type N-terminal cleavage/methylation domain-containing protein